MQKKQTEAQAKSKALADAQAKLQTSGAILSDAARAQLEKDIERMNVEGQRFQQDAQAEINELSQQLQGEFQQKLFPVLDQLIKEQDLHVLLSATDAGVVAANPGSISRSKPSRSSTRSPRPPSPPRRRRLRRGRAAPAPAPCRAQAVAVRTRRRRTRNLGRKRQFAV